MTDPQTGYNFGEMHKKHGQNSELLPEGVYDVEVEKATHKSSSDGSKPQLVVTFRIVDHPKASGRKVTNTFTFSTAKEQAIEIFFRHMAGLGFNGEFFAANPTNPFPVMAAQAPGRRARISVRHDTWQGTTRPKVNNVMPASGGAAGLGSGLPPAPGGGALPPLPSVQQLMQPPAPVAPSAPEPAPAVQEQAPAPAPAAPAVEQAPPAPAPETAPVPAGAVPPAPAVPF